MYQRQLREVTKTMVESLLHVHTETEYCQTRGKAPINNGWTIKDRREK